MFPFQYPELKESSLFEIGFTVGDEFLCPSEVKDIRRLVIKY